MSYNYEQSRTKLEELSNWYAANSMTRNEATTRLHLIDTLFLDCLGWSKRDVIAEEAHGGEYADYTFSTTKRSLIVEAKREGNYFELPVGSKKTIFSLKGITRDYPNVKEALEQVSRYCQERGVPFGVISNGHQLIAIIANRNDGIPPLEGKALVFDSFESMLDNFLQLWQSLSKVGVEERWLQNHLMGDIIHELPPKLSQTLTWYPGVKVRNGFQADLQNLSELVIEDILNSEELRKPFLQECYSQSGALSQYALISKSILQTKYATLFAPELSGPTTVPAVDRAGISSELLAESLSRRPILLIGDVGVGKTTFIRNLIYLEAAPLFENAITLYLNLGTQATMSFDLKAFVNDEIANQLLNKYDTDIFENKFVRGVYHGDLERFKKGINGDLRESNPDLYKIKEIEELTEKIKNKESHLKKSLQHIAKARKKQIIIFIDNADQRDEDIQQHAFLIAQEIADSWSPVTVFVALRPETFYRSSRIGALSGYHPKAFTISPPRIDKVIIKRLQFARKITRGQIPLESVSGLLINLKSLDNLLTAFLYSLEKNHDIVECIDNVAGGNVRLALDLVRGFLGSGHVDTRKIVDFVENGKRYTIPLHEFIRAIIFGDSEHYSSDQSPIANLFDISRPDPKEHFIMPLILSVIKILAGSNTEEGFVESSKIYEKIQGMGFLPDQIDLAIAKAHKKKLLETSARRIPLPGVEMPQMLRITTVGAYHLDKLTHFFAYIDAMIVDTPILDPKVRDEIRDVSAISDRVLRANEFKKYLDNQWVHLSKTIAQSFFNWKHVSGELQSNINYVRNKLT